MKGSKERKKARMHEKGMRKQRFRSYTYLTRCIIPSKLEKLKVHEKKVKKSIGWINTGPIKSLFLTRNWRSTSLHVMVQNGTHVRYVNAAIEDTPEPYYTHCLVLPCLALSCIHRAN